MPAAGDRIEGDTDAIHAGAKQSAPQPAPSSMGTLATPIPAGTIVGAILGGAVAPGVGALFTANQALLAGKQDSQSWGKSAAADVMSANNIEAALNLATLGATGATQLLSLSQQGGSSSGSSGGSSSGGTQGGGTAGSGTNGTTPGTGAHGATPGTGTSGAGSGNPSVTPVTPPGGHLPGHAPTAPSTGTTHTLSA